MKLLQILFTVFFLIFDIIEQQIAINLFGYEIPFLFGSVNKEGEFRYYDKNKKDGLHIKEKEIEEEILFYHGGDVDTSMEAVDDREFLQEFNPIIADGIKEEVTNNFPSEDRAVDDREFLQELNPIIADGIKEEVTNNFPSEDRIVENRGLSQGHDSVRDDLKGEVIGIPFKDGIVKDNKFYTQDRTESYPDTNKNSFISSDNSLTKIPISQEARDKEIQNEAIIIESKRLIDQETTPYDDYQPPQVFEGDVQNNAIVESTNPRHQEHVQDKTKSTEQDKTKSTEISSVENVISPEYLDEIVELNNNELNNNKLNNNELNNNSTNTPTSINKSKIEKGKIPELKFELEDIKGIFNEDYIKNISFFDINDKTLLALLDLINNTKYGNKIEKIFNNSTKNLMQKDKKIKTKDQRLINESKINILNSILEFTNTREDIEIKNIVSRKINLIVGNFNEHVKNDKNFWKVICQSSAKKTEYFVPDSLKQVPKSNIKDLLMGISYNSYTYKIGIYGLYFDGKQNFYTKYYDQINDFSGFLISVYNRNSFLIKKNSFTFSNISVGVGSFSTEKLLSLEEIGFENEHASYSGRLLSYGSFALGNNYTYADKLVFMPSIGFSAIFIQGVQYSTQNMDIKKISSIGNSYSLLCYPRLKIQPYKIPIKNNFFLGLETSISGKINLKTSYPEISATLCGPQNKEILSTKVKNMHNIGPIKDLDNFLLDIGAGIIYKDICSCTLNISLEKSFSFRQNGRGSFSIFPNINFQFRI